MRLTELRSLMDVHFGPVRAPSVASDHVFAALGDRTVKQAIAAGLETRDIWFAICDAFDVPDKLRWGLPD